MGSEELERIVDGLQEKAVRLAKIGAMTFTSCAMLAIFTMLAWLTKELRKLATTSASSRL